MVISPIPFTVLLIAVGVNCCDIAIVAVCSRSDGGYALVVSPDFNAGYDHDDHSIEFVVFVCCTIQHITTYKSYSLWISGCWWVFPSQ